MTTPYYGNTSAPLGGQLQGSVVNYARQNKQWFVRVSAVNHGQTLTNQSAVIKTIGFDTIDFNTYQALGESIYSLAFIGATIGGHSYPYTEVVIPVAGIYEVDFVYSIDSAGAGTAMEIAAYIMLNGSAQMFENRQTPGAQGTTVTSVSVRDVFECSPGDVINAGAYMLDQSGTSLVVLASDNLTRMVIRYCGTG